MSPRTLCFFSLAAALAVAQTAPRPQRGLTVTVLQGDGVVHALPNPPVSHISVRVTDADGKPLQGAVAVFELPELGPSATFPDGSQVKVILTDREGAAATELQSNGVPGHFEPKVTVNYLGQTAVASLKQESAFNPDVRPDVYRRALLAHPSAHDTGSHGLSKKAVWIIVGAAAAGGVGAIFALHGGNHAPAATTPPPSGGGSITITPGGGTVVGGGH